MDETKAAIVIPALNEVENIGALLDDFARRNPSAAEVIVVDAGSTEGTTSWRCGGDDGEHDGY
jgi:glycosyltransferase involved in cell wall biosynthesis